MFFKHYTSLLISTSILVQSVSPTFAMYNDSVEKLEMNLSKLKQYNSTPGSLDFVSKPGKTAAGVLHWAVYNDQVHILLGKRDDTKDQDIGEWCNFGGKSDVVDNDQLFPGRTSENLTHTAAREACEESNGIYAHHPRLLRKQPFIALYSPEQNDGFLHYMYWQQVQYLEPEIFNKKVKTAKEEYSKEYTDFMWIKASLLHQAVESQTPLLEVDGKKIVIFSPLFSSLSTEAGKIFLHELVIHKKIRQFNKGVRPFCNRLYIEKDQNENTTDIIPSDMIDIHWKIPKVKPITLSTIPFGENAYGKDYSLRQIIDSKGETLSEDVVVSDKMKEEDIFAGAVAAHGMAMVELKRRFQPIIQPQVESNSQWDPHCEETLSRIHLRIILGEDYKTSKDFLEFDNPRRKSDIANIKKYFTIDNQAEMGQKGNEFKREIKLLEGDYDFFADVFEWEDENRQWPTFVHGASAKQNNMFKSFTYMRELIDMRSFKDLMALRGTDIYFKNDKTVWDMLQRTGAQEGSETNSAMLFLNFVILAGLKTTKSTSSTAEYVLNDHSVDEQNISERFEEALALAGFSSPNYAYFQSIFEQFVAHKNPTAGNSVLVAISQNPKDLDEYNYPTICGHYYDPSTREISGNLSIEGEKDNPSFSTKDSDSNSHAEHEGVKKSQKIKSTLQILQGIQNEFERQKKSGFESFTTNPNAKRSLFPENRFFIHPNRVMDPTKTRIKAFDRFPLNEEEGHLHDQEMRRTTIATMADWLAQKTIVMEGSFINYPALKKLHKIIYKGVAGEDVIETASIDGLFHLAQNGHLEAVKRYLENYPEIDPTTLAGAVLASKNHTQIDYFLNEVFKGDWKVFIEKHDAKSGTTPLHLAVEACHEDLVKNFLNSNLIDPNTKNEEGFTPLAAALDVLMEEERVPQKTPQSSSSRLFNITKILIESDRVNPLVSDDEFSLLDLMFTEDLKKITELLILNNKFGLTLTGHDITNLIIQDRYSVKRFLTFSKNPEILLSESLNECMYLHTLETVKFLLTCEGIDVDVNIQDEYGKTPLINSIAYNKLDITSLLLNSENVEFDIIDKNGNTALHLAACAKLIEIVETLLTKGANVSALENNGHNPFYSAYDIEIGNLLREAYERQMSTKSKQ